MKLAYACACIYRLDKYQQSRGSMYSKIYLDYVQDMKKGFSLHLVQKKNDLLVSACVDYFKKTVNRLNILLEYPEKIGCVCNCFHICYSRIWSFFEGVDQLGKAPSRRSLIQHIHSRRLWYDICNSCMSCFVMSLREFFLP